MTPQTQQPAAGDEIERIIAKHMQEHAVDFKAGHQHLLIEQLAALITKKEAEARLSERKQIALYNYQGQTFSDATNWHGKFDKFVENNEKRIASLRAATEQTNG